MSLSEDASRRLHDVRARVSGALRQPEANIEHAMHDIRDAVSREAHHAEDIMDDLGARARNTLSLSPSSSSRHKPKSAHHDEDEEWMSDAEGDGDGDPAGGSSADGRQKSRSPKSKAPKMAVALKPHGGRRRMSIRRGMLGARVPLSKDPQEERASSRDGEREESAEQQDRGRRLRTVDSRASSVRLMHHRVDSLRSIDTATRRDASPTRSIRWADESEGGRRSGLNSPGILSPVGRSSPLPAGSDNEDEEVEEGNTPTSQQPSVRFSVPDMSDRPSSGGTRS
ncbi:hypothetical protein BC835DRAFT_917083 [Cytidiella melzeri]|nr:hypothetical protein BC835DRAFT_917083 [Cytidiella melzeri]